MKASVPGFLGRGSRRRFLMLSEAKHDFAVHRALVFPSRAFNLCAKIRRNPNFEVGISIRHIVLLWPFLGGPLLAQSLCAIKEKIVAHEIVAIFLMMGISRSEGL